MPAQQGYQHDLSFLITTPIHTEGPDTGGTGFFFHVDTKTYLITAGHVLAGENGDSFGDEVQSVVHQDPPELTYFLRDSDDATETSRYSADLSCSDRTWGLDPNGADVAAIQLDENLLPLPDYFDLGEDEGNPQYSSFSLMEHQFIGNKKLLTDRAFSLGYPGRLFDAQSKFPIKRNTLLASPIHFEFEGEEKFLTDARMDPGTSGSPVLVRPSQVRHPWGEPITQTHETPVLLGIHTANYPHIDESAETEEGCLRDARYSDLNETWRPETIMRTIRNAVSG